jgi:hypothetical protein
MKKIGQIVFVCLIITNLISYKSCRNIKESLKSEKQNVIALKKSCDSILALPPDTIKLPSKIIKKDSLVYITKYINTPTLSAKQYTDSIINDSIDLRVSILADKLYSINYAYKPIFKYQEIIIEKKIPYPVDVIKEIKVLQRGFYFNAGLGFSEKFAGKLEMLYLTKKKSTFGIEYMKYGYDNIYLVSYGVKL